MTSAAVRHADVNRDRFERDLAAFIRFPSIGADPRRRADVQRCARWLGGRLRHAGLQEVAVVPTAGSPIVYGAWHGAAAHAPTLLVYGHYDVQPAEPLAAWRSPPFEPTQRGSDLVGRGSCDDKGPLLCHVAAIEAHLATAGRLPTDIVCIFEGEEEHGSPHLPAFLRAQRARLAPAAAVMSDTRMLGPLRPVIVQGTRGALSLGLELDRAGEDVHSGQFGGAVPNAVEALCAIVARLHDARGRIDVPGIYDRVRALPADERTRLAREAPSDAEILRDAGVDTAAGEAGFSAYERTTLRPALTVTDITGGFTGPGGKSAVPAQAAARLNLRLVCDQDPDDVARLMCARLRSLVPAGLDLTIRVGAGSAPTTIDAGDPAVRAAAEALRRAFGRPPVLLHSGGTIPIVGEFQRLFGVPTVLMGFALPDGGMHAPNEKANLPTLHRGTRACIEFLDLVGSALRTRDHRRVAA